MNLGTTLIWIGVVVIVIGGVLRWAPWLLSWFGNLPGDVRYRGENVTVFFPITSMILVSVAATILLSLLRRGGP